MKSIAVSFPLSKNETRENYVDFRGDGVEGFQDMRFGSGLRAWSERFGKGLGEGREPNES